MKKTAIFALMAASCLTLQAFASEEEQENIPTAQTEKPAAPAEEATPPANSMSFLLNQDEEEANPALAVNEETEEETLSFGEDQEQEKSLA